MFKAIISKCLTPLVALSGLFITLFVAKKSVEKAAVSEERQEQNEKALKRDIEMHEVAREIDFEIDLIDDDELDDIVQQIVRKDR